MELTTHEMVGYGIAAAGLLSFSASALHAMLSKRNIEQQAQRLIEEARSRGVNQEWCYHPSGSYVTRWIEVQYAGRTMRVDPNLASAYPEVAVSEVVAMIRAAEDDNSEKGGTSK